MLCVINNFHFDDPLPRINIEHENIPASTHILRIIGSIENREDD